MKLTMGLIEKLSRLVSGEAIPSSEIKGELRETLLKEGLLDTESRGSFIKYRATSTKNLQSFLAGQNDAFRNLKETLNFLAEKEVNRAEQTKNSGNSKMIRSRSCPGFLVNSYELIDCELCGVKSTLAPLEGSAIFISDYRNFRISEDILVVGVENMENFLKIRGQKYLFESHASTMFKKILFVARYPQTGDLGEWLRCIPNKYLHFGDLDLAGVSIYLTEFYKLLDNRASFFIPDDAEERIRNGSIERYDSQISKFENMAIPDSRVQSIVKLIRKYHRCYDQEGYIK